MIATGIPPLAEVANMHRELKQAIASNEVKIDKVAQCVMDLRADMSTFTDKADKTLHLIAGYFGSSRSEVPDPATFVKYSEYQEFAKEITGSVVNIRNDVYRMTQLLSDLPKLVERSMRLDADHTVHATSNASSAPLDGPSGVDLGSTTQKTTVTLGAPFQFPTCSFDVLMKKWFLGQAPSFSPYRLNTNWHKQDKPRVSAARKVIIVVEQLLLQNGHLKTNDIATDLDDHGNEKDTRLEELCRLGVGLFAEQYSSSSGDIAWSYNYMRKLIGKYDDTP
jgi:hypothetical protein